jgi:hypothetical protein
MSIINSDGLNTNWQLNVLKGLQGIIDELNSTINVNGSVNANIVSPLGIRTETESVSVALSSEQWREIIRPVLIISSGDIPTLITAKPRSISFASNGTDPALVSFDSGATYEQIPPGTTLNMDAGGIANYYEVDTFGYDTSTDGASLIITYNL